MDYFITIKSKFSDEEAQSLWHKIEHMKPNMLVAKELHVYGNAKESEVKDILYECSKLGADLQLNIK